MPNFIVNIVLASCVCLQSWVEVMERGMAAGYHFCRANFLSMKTLKVRKICH